MFNIYSIHTDASASSIFSYDQTIYFAVENDETDEKNENQMQTYGFVYGIAGDY